MSGHSSKSIRIEVIGPIGETTPFFNTPLAGVDELILDMARMTYINSIGVKHWILWTVKIPKSCKVQLLNCPLMIVSQATTVLGFVIPNMFIESFRLPYVCESCGHEEVRTVRRGSHYHYATESSPAQLNVELHAQCPKCKASALEPDVILDKTFRFLSP